MNISNVGRGALFFAAMIFGMNAGASEPMTVPETHVTRGSQWEGKRVGVLGDSMSDPEVGATSLRYYNYLESLLGIEALPYARNGYKMAELLPLAEKMYREQGDSIDAIFIWCGTNDFNGSKPIGEFCVEETADVNADGVVVARKHRVPVMSDSTFCGSINMVLSYLKYRFPKQQIIIFTPIHRGFAQFGDRNVQPDESYSNGVGKYIDDYVDALCRAGKLWSVPVIDYFGVSGLFPVMDSHDDYVANKSTDRLHPNDAGHYRLARTAQYQLLGFPATFKE